MKIKPKKKKIDNDTVLVSDRLYVPLHLANRKKIKRNYLVYRYELKNCLQCDNRYDKHNYLCDQCGAFKGKYKLYSDTVIGGREYFGLPLGDKLDLVKKAGINSKAFDNLIDLRSAPKLGFDLKFVGSMRSYQDQAIEQWSEHSFGQIMAPPRSGKTVMLVKLTTMLGVKTLILAHQVDLLKQAYASFYKDEDGNDFTNMAELEETLGRKLVVIAKTRKDLLKYPIVLSTYQKFISPAGKKFLEKVKNKFGIVFVDEAHKGSADCFSKVLAKFESRYKCGLTATPTRKDRMEFLTQHIVGPVTSRVDPPQVRPRVIIHGTGVIPQRAYKSWMPAMQFLARNEDRQRKIVRQVVKDVKAGHHVLIPVIFVKQATDLTEAINKALYKAFKKKNLAAAFTGRTLNRGGLLTKAKSGKIKVVVGIRSLVQAGINVPLWSCLYEISPISNVPNHTQETARIRTPMEGKLQPLIRHWVDENMGMCLGCFRTCWSVYKDFEISKKSRAKVDKILRARPSQSASVDLDDEAFTPSPFGFGKINTHVK
jgi:superfamily II DNA or RNA helicase